MTRTTGARRRRGSTSSSTSAPGSTASRSTSSTRARRTTTRSRCSSRTAGPVPSSSSSTSSHGSPTRAHGGRADAFHVVAPSLPGYGFSEPTRTPGWDAWRIAARVRRADASARLRALWRAGGRLGRAGRDEDRLRSIPTTARRSTSTWRSPTARTDAGPLTDQEQADLAAMARFQREEAGYAHRAGDQAADAGRRRSTTRRRGCSPGSSRSSARGATATAIPRTCFTRDQLITNVMTYWVTQTITSSARLVLGAHARSAGATGVRRASPPASRGSRRRCSASRAPWVERRYNVTHWTEMPRGGHFAAMEQPDLFVDDVRSFFRTVRWRSWRR